MPTMRVLVFLLPLLIASCGNWGASREDKETSLEANLAEWKIKAKLRPYMLSRTVQIFESNGSQIREGRVDFKSEIGLAAVVTPDGYALTAAHVVDSPPHCIFAAATRDLPLTPVHGKKSEMVFAIHDKEGNIIDRAMVQRSVFEIWTSAGARVLDQSDSPRLEKLPVRVVHRWPGTDLTLVKLPLRNLPYFKVRNRLEPGTALFAPGNHLSKAPVPSAGKILKTSRTREISRITSSLPLCPGDSGGPAVDGDGRLAGIASLAIPPGLLPVPPFTHSVLVFPDSANLEELIKADRRNHPATR